jgi:MFS family permease
MASANTVLQTLVDDDKRGRVMSLFTMAFLGVAPFGSLLAGAVADRIGPQWTLVTAGGACLCAGLTFATRLPALRPFIRPIYVQRGILPEVATGIQTTAALASTTHD